MGFDITKYAALLLKVFELEERLRSRTRQLRENPPKKVEEYVALVAEIQAITVELQALAKEVQDLLGSGDKVRPEDITAAHARNQQKWPKAQPVGEKLYDVQFFRQPSDADYMPGDRVFRNGDGSAWRVEAKDGPIIGWGGSWVLDHTVQ